MRGEAYLLLTRNAYLFTFFFQPGDPWRPNTEHRRVHQSCSFLFIVFYIILTFCRQVPTDASDFDFVAAFGLWFQILTDVSYLPIPIFGNSANLYSFTKLFIIYSVQILTIFTSALLYIHHVIFPKKAQHSPVWFYLRLFRAKSSGSSSSSCSPF